MLDSNILRTVHLPYDYLKFDITFKEFNVNG